MRSRSPSTRRGVARCGAAPAAPLPGIAQGDLREPHPVAPCHAGDVQVAVHDRLRPEAHVPVGGAHRAAPLRELRVAQHPRGVAGEGEVVDEHRRQPGRARGEPRFALADPRPAPRLPAGVGVGVQHQLVAAHHSGGVGARQRLLLGGGDVAAEGVVVEQEEGRHRGGPARPLPDGVGVLGGEHVQTPAELHQVPVARLPPQPQRVGRRAPQVVVAGHPHDRGEALAQHAQRPLQVGAQLADVAAHDQPVITRVPAQRPPRRDGSRGRLRAGR